MKEKIVLIGGGGHSKVVIDAIIAGDKYDIEGLIDPALRPGDAVLGVSVLGGDNKLEEIFARGIKNAFIAVGSVGDCRKRVAIYERVKKIGFNFPVIIHPRAVVARDVVIAAGTFVAASATINPGAVIGEQAIINTSASVDHDCRIGDFVHVAPGAVLSGNVEVKEGAHIGTGANIIQNICIGKYVLVKAGALAKENQ